MNELFLKTLNMSIAASWLVLAVLILRFALKKAPRWVSVLLWSIVALRLVFPFPIESAFSLIPSAETIPDRVLHGPTFAVQTGIAPVDHQINGYLSSHYFEGVTVSARQGFQVITLLALIWMAGIVILLAYTAVSYLRLRQRVSTAIPLRQNIYQSEYAVSPFVLGILNPKIYLSFQIGEQEQVAVIAHEQAHIQRKDHWWKPLGFLLLILHWFNPLMWLAYVLLCRDIELACDETVIRELDSEQRADYTQALLSCSVQRQTITACPLAFGEIGVKERVSAVMHYQKPSFRVVLLAVAACLAAAVCFLTNPKQDSFILKIVVPAHSQEQAIFFEEEISPTRDHILIASGEGLSDTEIFLKPVQSETAAASSDPHDLTPGILIKMDAEKGAWYKIGVKLQNTTAEDLVVSLKVTDVEVRIPAAHSPELEQYRTDYIGDAPKVAHIAQLLPYPENYAYASLELQTSAEPYELIVYLNGNAAVQREDFEDCASTAFSLIGNMGILSFRDAESKATIASFTRMD